MAESGRRGRFRICWGNSRGGSIPSASTNFHVDLGPLVGYSRESMDTSHLIDALRSLSRFLYIRVSDDLEFVKLVLELLPKYKERIWVLNASFGKLCLAKDYVDPHKHPEVPASSEASKSKFEYFGAFQEIFRHDPRDHEVFYIILDAEVWCSDPASQRWILDLRDHIGLDASMAKSFIFVSLTKDPIPEKLAPLFETIDDDVSPSPYSYASEMFNALQWDGESRPSEAECNEIFSGMTRYQVESAIVRTFIYARNPLDGSFKLPSNPDPVLRAVVRLLEFKAA